MAVELTVDGRLVELLGGTVAGSLVVALLGAIFGSFISALSWRLPRGMAIGRGRSHCPACDAALSPRDLVPILSWAVSRGRCRHCGAAVSIRYPAIEAVTAALFVAAAWSAPASLAALALMALVVPLVALAVIDLEHGLLPDVLILAALPPAAAWRWASGGTEGAVAGLVAAAVAVAAALLLRLGFRRVTGRDGLGLGDVKFAGVAGLVLRPGDWPSFLMLSGVLGVVLGTLWRWRGGGPAFPFGPALIAALLALLLVPDLGGPLLGLPE